MSNSKKIFISVVIPVYKSEHILPELHTRLQNVFKKMVVGYEIIMVNDCSPDNSWEIMSNLSTNNPETKSILLRKNVGYECAVMAGLSFAKGEYVVMMDDDLQHIPEDIPKLLNEIEKGFDVIYANFLNKQQSLIKNMGSWFNGKVAQLVINKPKDIYLSPFKIMKKDIVDEILRYEGLFPYVDGLIFRITSSINQIHITHHKRKIGSGNYNLYRSIKIWLSLATGFSTMPLRLTTFVGISMFIFSFFISLFLIVWKFFFGGEAPEGWATVILVVAAIGGIQLASIGIVGEYIARIFLDVSQKSRFAIKKMSNIT